jgi:hypothetical protein
MRSCEVDVRVSVVADNGDMCVCMYVCVFAEVHEVSALSFTDMNIVRGVIFRVKW